jgi:Rha family phage regulatory protein
MAQEIKGAALPALCAELGVRDEHGVPMVNSRALAERFEKNHQHVLRDIDNLIGGMSRSGQTRPWFHEIITINEQNGQSYRSFDLTRPGFALLVNRCIAASSGPGRP